MKKIKYIFFTVSLCSFLIVNPGFSDNKSVAEISIIRSGLNDQDREIRSLSAKIAGKIGDKGLIGDLQGLLKDTGDTVKITAAVSLHKLGDRSGIAVLRKILSTAPQLSETPTAIERARAVARGTIRAEAARTLGEIRDSDSVALLKKMLEDEDGRVVDASLVALARLGDTAAKNKFISALESTTPGIRAKAAEALGDIGDTGACPFLRKRLKDWDRDTKTAVALALGKLKDKESVAALTEILFLADKDEIVREKTVIALGMIGDPAAKDAVTKALQDANGFVRIAAAEALHRLGDDSGKEFLLKVLTTNEKDAKVRALNVLEEVAGVKDMSLIQPLLNDTEKSVAIMAADVIIHAKARKK